jgi:hypothetical protein
VAETIEEEVAVAVEAVIAVEEAPESETNRAADLDSMKVGLLGAITCLEPRGLGMPSRRIREREEITR